jgi:hypothetical protein
MTVIEKGSKLVLTAWMYYPAKVDPEQRAILHDMLETTLQEFVGEKVIIRVALEEEQQ